MHKLALGTVDYDEKGSIHFSGSAPPNAAVRLYVDNSPAGDAKAASDGHWTMSPPGEVQPGVHTLRLDQLSADGRVAARVELPFQREALALSQVANGQVVIQPGTEPVATGAARIWGRHPLHRHFRSKPGPDT